MTMLTLVLGGARSGKSEVAEGLAAEAGERVLYVATGQITDPAMAARVAAHRSRRPAAWQTVETSTDLADTIRTLPSQPAIIESLGTWVARYPAFDPDIDDLIAALRGRRAATIVVSEEVGLGVHPETEVGRQWRDALGDVNKAVGRLADSVLLVVAGRVMRI